MVPVVVQDACSKNVLMLAYVNAEALKKTKKTKKAWFYSRSRGRLWKKGETSGNDMLVKSIRWDCDRDALLYQVEPAGPACHTGGQTCFGPRAFGLEQLAKDLAAKKGVPDSYTARLLASPWLLAEKLCEEGAELAESRTRKQVVWEAADVLYFTLAKLAESGVPLKDVIAEMEKRHRRKEAVASE